MPRYIDADIAHEMLLRGYVINDVPTADVVPKSEIVRGIFDDIEKMLKDQEVVTENQRCKEVGDWLLHDYFLRKLAELKKKHIGESENDR